MLAFADFVQGSAHYSKVFLGCIGAAKTLGSRTIRYIIQKALGCCPNYSNDIGTTRGGSLCLLYVFVDIACCHNKIQ